MRNHLVPMMTLTLVNVGVFQLFGETILHYTGYLLTLRWRIPGCNRFVNYFYNLAMKWHDELYRLCGVGSPNLFFQGSADVAVSPALVTGFVVL